MRFDSVPGLCARACLERCPPGRHERAARATRRPLLAPRNPPPFRRLLTHPSPSPFRPAALSHGFSRLFLSAFLPPSHTSLPPLPSHPSKGTPRDPTSTETAPSPPAPTDPLALKASRPRLSVQPQPLSASASEPPPPVHTSLEHTPLARQFRGLRPPDRRLALNPDSIALVCLPADSAYPKIPSPVFLLLSTLSISLLASALDPPRGLA